MGRNNQDGYFGIIISAKILENREISVAEKMVYAYVASYKNFCADSNGRIADRLGLSERTVIRSLNSLEKLGYICLRYQHDNGTGRRIYDIYDKPNKSTVLSRKGKKSALNNRGELASYPQVFPQRAQNAGWGDKMSVWGDKMSVQKTGDGMTKCHPKNNKNKKKKEKPNTNRTRKMAAGLAGLMPASRHSYTDGKVVKLSELLNLGAN